jgi:carbonic anhydrase/acetyltransferase-like protein (isoleucine patch superfamily)
MSSDDRISRHLDAVPRIPPSCFIAGNATVLGDVTLGEECSVWYQAVLRGDINRISFGPRSNIQDGAIVHLADEYGVEAGELVTVGHKAILHACKIGNEVLVGMGAIVLDGAVIGSRCIIGAGALVTGGKHFPDGSLIVGAHAKVARALSLEVQAGIRTWADRYVHLSREYLRRGNA